MNLRKIFGSKRDDVTGEWRRLYNEELYDLHFSPDIIRVLRSSRMSRVEYVARMGGEQWCIPGLVWKSEGKRPHGRPRRR